MRTKPTESQQKSAAKPPLKTRQTSAKYRQTSANHQPTITNIAPKIRRTSTQKCQTSPRFCQHCRHKSPSIAKFRQQSNNNRSKLPTFCHTSAKSHKKPIKIIQNLPNSAKNPKTNHPHNSVRIPPTIAKTQ